MITMKQGKFTIQVHYGNDNGGENHSFGPGIHIFHSDMNEAVKETARRLVSLVARE